LLWNGCRQHRRGIGSTCAARSSFLEAPLNLINDALASRHIFNGAIAQQEGHDLAHGRMVWAGRKGVRLPTAGELIQPPDHRLIAVALLAF
jgi:hypothetical protein